MFKRFIEELQHNAKKKPRKLRQNEIFVLPKKKKKIKKIKKINKKKY
jgi:hypothetical protein|tara:strand:+ start:754 stop:894 length:141 start_codon:yes stop_codon:yes gene_type:complete